MKDSSRLIKLQRDKEIEKRKQKEKQKFLAQVLILKQETLYPITLLIDAILILFSIITLIIIFSAYYQIITVEDNLIEDIGLNWSKGPIIDIYFGDKCDNHFIEDRWQGIVDGCVCITPSGAFINLPNSPCLWSLPFECTLYLNITRPIYAKWKREEICTTLMDTNYLNLNIAESEAICISKGLKSCGIIDNVGNYLCSDREKACPINFLQFYKPQDTISLNGTSVTLPDGKIFYTNQSTSSNIPVQFKVSDGLPCINPLQINSNSTTYLMDPFFAKDSCLEVNKKNYDDSYTYFDSYRKSNLYSENGIIDIMNTINGHPTSNYTDLTSIYFRSYVGINMDCRNSIIASSPTVINDMINFSAALNRFKNIGYKYMILLELGTTILATFCFVFFYVLKKDKIKATDLPIRFFSDFGLVISNFLIISVKTTELNNYKNLLEILNTPYCFNAENYFIINDLTTNIRGFYNNAILSNIFAGLAAAFYLLHFLLLVYFNLKSINIRYQYEKLKKIILD